LCTKTFVQQQQQQQKQQQHRDTVVACALVLLHQECSTMSQINYDEFILNQ
jgi:hypothetical protein